MVVRALIRKMRRAIGLLNSSKTAYTKLTETASNAQINSWREGESNAQDDRVDNYKSMDYFALRTGKGGILCH